jgi:hypothetical protein
MFAKSVVAAAFLPLAVLAQEPPFMGAGSWEIAAPRNNRFTLNLQLDSVTPQGVTGTITGNVFWKCQETLPITGSSVEPDRITVRSINAEDERVPSACDRTITFIDADGKIIVTIDSASGRSRMKVRKRPSNWSLGSGPGVTPP